MSKRRITLIYCIGIFGESWVLQLGGLHSVAGDVGNRAITPWLLGAMMCPALGVLMLMAFCKPACGDVLWKANWVRLRSRPIAC